MSDMDSDCDDVFSEDAKVYHVENGSKNSTGVEVEGRHLLNRKRRRGIIEKRRRDRINSSLTELRRLVPAAFEKQGSAKLEKAEILQMTVDHLRILHSKGMDVFNLDPHSFVLDYHGIGFRECASEVARYLVGFEGLDLQDPLRLRLMSHLQCFSSRRDPTWFPAVPTPQYPRTSVFSSSSERRPSSASSGLSMESSGSSRSSPRMRTQIPLSPVALNASSLVGGFSKTSEVPSSVRPYRPWGTEMAY